MKISKITPASYKLKIKGINTKKATGPDTIPPKLVKMSADIIDIHLCNIINKDVEKSSFSDGAKIASVKPVYKNKSRNELENYRPVSILNVFKGIREIHSQFSNPFRIFIRIYISI